MHSEAVSQKPRLRILHQMARTGGTVICRCLASMEDVVLLSEIHPQGIRMFNPLQQAQEWYGLLQADELQAAKNGEFTFESAISLIAGRCEQLGKILLIRDWSHLDFIGIPFTQAGYRPRLAEILADRFDMLRLATVRHPLDQWLSLTRNPLFASQLAVGKYLKGTRRFAEMAHVTGFVRYEDFTENTDQALVAMCNALDVPFDLAYRQRWSSYRNITGDVLPGRSGAAEVSTLPRPKMNEADLETFTGRPDYTRTLELLGYPS